MEETPCSALPRRWRVHPGDCHAPPDRARRLSAIDLVVASSAWAAPAPWVPNTSGNVGPAPTTFNKWTAIEAPAASGASCGNGSPYRSSSSTAPPTDRKFNRMRPSMARVLGLETRSARKVERSLAAQWQELGRQYAFGPGARSCFPAAMDTAASLGHQLTRWSTSSG